MNTFERIDLRAAEWLARQDAGPWSADDQQTLNGWLAETTAHRVALLRLRAAWRRADGLIAVAGETQHDDVENGAHATPALQITSRSGRARLSVRQWLLSGAMLVIVVVAAWIGLGSRNEAESYVTAVGARQTIQLADGSKLILNTHSQARVAINSHSRRLWLDYGEAYLEVEHEPLRPFVVTSGAAQLTVVGTRFAIRQEPEFTRVMVLDGKVLVDRNTDGTKLGKRQSDTEGRGFALPNGPIMLSANDVATIQQGNLLSQNTHPDQLGRELSWREGKLNFEQRSLKEIAAEFNRYNRKQLVVDPAIAGVRLGGSFEATNLTGFIGLVRDRFGIKVVETVQQIHLSK